MKHCWHPSWDTLHPGLRPTCLMCTGKLREICCFCGLSRIVDYDFTSKRIIQHHGPFVFEREREVYLKSPGQLTHILDDAECPIRAGEDKCQ